MIVTMRRCAAFPSACAADRWPGRRVGQATNELAEWYLGLRRCLARGASISWGSRSRVIAPEP